MSFRRSVSALAPHVLLGLLLSGAVLTGCDLFGGDDADAPLPQTTSVFVANGGNFADQNGTITVYDPQRTQAATPPGLALNAFVHSLALHNGQLYAALNTGFSSGRVDVFEADSYAPAAQSDSLGATRYAAFDDNDSTRAYVSTLRGTVHRFRPSTGALSGAPVDVGASASGLLTTNNKVFVTRPDTSLALGDTVANNGSSLAVFDAGQPSSLRTIALGCDGPTSIAQDEDGDLVVVCTGRTTFDSNFQPLGRTNGAIVFVDPDTESVRSRIDLEEQLGTITGTQVAHYDPTTEHLHAASSRTGSIFRVDTDANALDGRLSVPQDESLTGIAAVAYDGASQRLYVARTDVQDPFQSNGTVVVLAENADRILDQFTVGPAPSHIVLRRSPA